MKNEGQDIALKFVRFMALNHKLLPKWNDQRLKDFVGITQVINTAARLPLLYHIVLLINLLRGPVFRPFLSLLIPLLLLLPFSGVKSSSTLCFRLLLVYSVHFCLVRLLLLIRLLIINMIRAFVIVRKASL